ncbi:MAG TPA: ABC transporter substrate-binding protein [Methanocorpusculum sp.]|nr:ABC transporter substrate-binding protein [Methanocorpusculum sp.]
MKHTARYKILISGILLSVFLAVIASAGCVSTQGAQDAPNGDTVTIQDVFGRTLQIPAHPQNIATAGTASARFLTYLDAADTITSVDFGETRPQRLTYDPRPFALANRNFTTLPAVTTETGAVNPEVLLSLNPDLLVLSTESAAGIAEADKITEKTGIPVVLIDETANLGAHRSLFDANIHLLAKILGKEDRAKELLGYIDDTLADLAARTKDVPASEIPSVYIGGVAYSGAHGLTYTEPNYPPFAYLGIDNIAKTSDKTTTLAVEISKEKLLEWDPDVIFIDAATLRCFADKNAFESLKGDDLYSGLKAVKNNAVYVTIPYIWSGINHESSLANAYFIGYVLFPKQFADIDPVKKADEIYQQFVSKPVFGELNSFLNNLGFTRYNLKQ